MRPTAILILLLALVAPAMSQTQTILDVSQPGKYVLTISATGVASITGPHAVVTPGGVVVPVVPPVVPPVIPPQPTTKAEQIKAAAATVSDPLKATTATNLATLMEMIESQVKAGTLKDYTAISATVNWMWDQITKGRESNWKPVKDLVGNHLAAMAQEGAQPEEYAGYFADAGEALSAAVPVTYESAEDPLAIDMDKLMKLFEFFVTFILPLILR